MILLHKHLIGIAVGSAFASTCAFAEESTSIAEALSAGKTNLHLRLRYEDVTDSALDDASALTIKTRLSFVSGTYEGFGLAVEMDDTTAITDVDYRDGAGTGTPNEVVIADPEVTEVNQAYLSYHNWQSDFKWGRQRIILDNQRFVGGVGWRQDEQTFDGFSVNSNPAEGLALHASYITQVNRIFAETQDHNHETILLNAKYDTAFGAIIGYGYLIENKTVQALTSDTVGARWQGKAGKYITYNLEYANQSADDQTDIDPAAIEYSADYMLAEVTGDIPVAKTAINVMAGYEVLGSDEGAKAFTTSLATLHAFQGWTDKFLNTPNTGIKDMYVSVGTTISSIKLGLIYHTMEADFGDITYGDEIDFVASSKVGPVALTLKYADFTADDDFASSDTSKLWLMAAMSF